MKKQIYYTIVISGLLFSANSFAAIANCVATNAKTGQSFAADGGGPNQIRANQVAKNKALGKCHAESAGWPGQCTISQCTPN